MAGITYSSTNFQAEPVGFKEALIQGQAPDRGLYIPNRIPVVSPEELASFESMSYPEIAFQVTNKFLKGEIPESELLRITKESYNFDVPIEHIDGKKHVMRLDRGPTASFKDFAARMMAREMEYFLKEVKKKIKILTATSGDTGSAVGDAYCGLENIDVTILFPEKEVTERQRKQMTTLGKNITAIAVDGKFDNCQALVKQAFADSELRHMNLSSANSINIGRLLPQSIYYFYAYSRVGECGGVVYSVPCGNFGDLTGGLIAQRMGLPVKRFVAAVNENDEFPVFLNTGAYKPVVPSKNCLSNAMNVGNPSNLPRIVAFYEGRMDEKGAIHKQPNMELMKKELFSVSISDERTRETIRSAYENYGLILEPHGAVGWAGLEDLTSREKSTSPCISLETADPAKFPEEIERTLGLKPKIPESLKSIESKKEHYLTIDADYEQFKKHLILMHA